MRRRLTNQLLAYAGSFEAILCHIRLSDLVAEMACLLETVSSSHARLGFELAVGLPAVELNPTQLRQIVMNLITNASDALGDRGGAITIRTGIATLNTKYCVAADGTRADVSPEATCVYVEVEDDGPAWTRIRVIGFPTLVSVPRSKAADLVSQRYEASCASTAARWNWKRRPDGAPDSES